MKHIEDLRRDVRYAARHFRRSPGFVVLSVLIMALGIGANTAVFSVVNAVLLKPLSYRDADRIVTLTGTASRPDAPTALPKQVSIPDFQDWHDQSSSFEAMAYYQSVESAVMAGSTAEYARVGGVSPEFFRVFEVEPIIGRSFTADEMMPNGAGAVLISNAYWNSHFGGDPRALGQTIRVFGRAQPIIGVLPPGFSFPGKTDMWVRRILRGNESRGGHNDLAVGRLKPGVSLQQAEADMTAIAARLEHEYPQTNKGLGVVVQRMRDEMVGNVRLTLYLLWAAVTVVLLIACANTATLLLGKATARTREIAVRAALGAGRQRILKQLITESVLLAIAAGLCGLLFAYWASKGLVALAPADLPRLSETAIDGWVLGFTIAMSLVTILFFGLVPAVYSSKVDLNDALKRAAARSVTGRGMVRIRGVLVVSEIALAVALLTGAGLLIKSFVALHEVDLGFVAENVLVMKATVPAATPEAAGRFFSDVLPKIGLLPGVLAAGATMAPPGNVGSSGAYFIDYRPEQVDLASAPYAIKNIVASGTFAALGIPLKRGRDFTGGDTRDKPPVAIVNEALVRKSFPGADPIGRTIFCPFDTFAAMTVVGVVGDVRQRGPASDPMPECYMPHTQHAFNANTLSIVVRTAGTSTALAEALRRAAHDTSPQVPVTLTTMERAFSDNVSMPRFRSLLFGVFAALAVCLAMAGVYGVMAFVVGQRSNEIGLRMALGANASSIARLILAQGLTLAAIGLVLGLAAAAIASRLLTTLLFNVQANDLGVYVAVSLLLGIVTVVASYVPAKRASKIDPLTALRQE
jgi:putative ABC transport system permease protein